MPYTIDWIVERRIILTTFYGSITADELKEFIAEVRAKAADGIPLVHHISNSLSLRGVEFSLGTARNLVGALDMLKELTWQIDINTNPINRMFANIIAQFAGMRTRTFKTPEEAVDFLRTNDPTLQDTEWNMALLEDTDATINLQETL